jgi:predicted transposase YbfD/YdcC
MEKRYEQLMRVLGLPIKKVVSRSQLPLILESVSVTVFDQLLFENYGVKLNEEEAKWFAIDGKELRGSIEKGNKRGEAMVQAVCHETLCSYGQDYYSGDKESEIPVVRKMLKDKSLAKQKLTFDALHCQVKTLEPIVRAGGKYVVGLKENQKEMYWEVKKMLKYLPLVYETKTLEKGHGRIEEREYQVYEIEGIYKDERWSDCELKKVIKVNREREELKSGKKSIGQSFYLTNETQKHQEICEAVRNHWGVETNNHLRDVTLKEDALRTKKTCKSSNDRNKNIGNKSLSGNKM